MIINNILYCYNKCDFYSGLYQFLPVAKTRRKGLTIEQHFDILILDGWRMDDVGHIYCPQCSGVNFRG